MDKNDAKERSLRKWLAIRRDCKNIKIRAHAACNAYLHPADEYGPCGFCMLHNEYCHACELYHLRICSNNPRKDVLYWQICAKIYEIKIKGDSITGLHAMINRMIKAIREA